MTTKEANKKLKELGAKTEIVDGGIKIIGSWADRYAPYHEHVVAIIGALYTPFTKQDPNFLPNLKELAALYTLNAKQHPNFLRNLKVLAVLYTYNAKQYPDFLRNLEVLGWLDTYNTKQDPDFLRNLKVLGYVDTYKTKQDPGFLSGVGEVKEPYIFADGILSRILSTKQVEEYTVYKTNRVGYSQIEYIATDGKEYAHAKSIKMALLDLRFKLSDRDTDWLRDKKLDDVLSFEDAVLAYRCVTGACSGGVEGFLENRQTRDTYTIVEIIKETEGQYKSEVFAEFFGHRR